MKKILTTLIFALSATSGYAIEGCYTVSGFDPYWKKSEYKGEVEITKDKNDVYQAKWVVGDIVSLGTGLKTNNMVSFVFTSPEPGVIVYKIDNDTLNGSFVYLGKSLIGNEKLQKK
jgi:hypothetical protein